MSYKLFDKLAGSVCTAYNTRENAERGLMHHEEESKKSGYHIPGRYEIIDEAIEDPTNAQLRRQDKTNTFEMTKQDVINHMIELLGDIKLWENRIDRMIISRKMDDLESLSNDLMSVNM